jgi:hypothetical protein
MEISVIVFITAVIFTILGYIMCASIITPRLTAVIIRNLINSGYLKTKGEGKHKVILKYDQE